MSVLIGFVTSKNLVVDWNPEFQFWQECVAEKRSELGELQAKHKRVVIFAGGSSCSFSIDPTVIMREAGVPSYNMGGAVPMGAKYIVSLGTESARAGDILVLALEPSFLTSPEALKSKTLGISLACDDLGNEIPSQSLTLEEKLFKRRPGAQFLATFLGKKVLKMKPYRYTMLDFQRGGRLETKYRDEWKNPAGLNHTQRLTSEGVALLQEIVKMADEKDVQLYYSLPWTFTDTTAVESNRRVNKKTLQEIAEYLPVLHDPAYGVVDDAQYFADTSNHLTGEGARMRSCVIARSLAMLAEDLEF